MEDNKFVAVGRIIADLGERSGTSQAGKPWKAHEYVLETHDAYPQKIAFDFFGDRADQYILHIGDEVRLSFEISSREYNNRWYVSCRGWRCEPATAPAAQAAPAPAPAYGAPAPAPAYTAPAAPAAPVAPANPNEDLPF